MLKPNIEELITKSGLRKGYIAEKLTISVRQLRKYETGESYIPIEKAYILACLLQVKVDELYTYIEKE
ncbi:helix-turn-helix transcriptional regulator [Neobacillus sp. WH10]|uniref:helix-turn-helix domain-containing protein n=1 Tax=Neobacillus sp. WH10 TaxID=3047873 RepID=UPI0024C15681|nr:helix-turn-helix transcriptional regulator [Neobacillus sp. WH10]WHY76213.1 helix-turn-helix transcriptional regulator [Neobacillus sp. WH10]